MIQCRFLATFYHDGIVAAFRDRVGSWEHSPYCVSRRKKRTSRGDGPESCHFLDQSFDIPQLASMYLPHSLDHRGAPIQYVDQELKIGHSLMLWDDKVAPWGVGLLCTQWQVGAWGAKVPAASIQAALYISIHCILAPLYSIHSYSLGNLPNVLSTGPSPVLLYTTPRTQQALCQIFLSTPTKKWRL